MQGGSQAGASHLSFSLPCSNRSNSIGIGKPCLCQAVDSLCIVDSVQSQNGPQKILKAISVFQFASEN